MNNTKKIRTILELKDKFHSSALYIASRESYKATKKKNISYYTIEPEGEKIPTREAKKLLEELWARFFVTRNILKGIRDKSWKSTEAKFDSLYSLLYQEDNIYKAISNLSKNKGSTTAGIDLETFDGLKEGMVKQLAKNLKERKFNFSPVKQIMIPKPGKTTLRPIGIPTIRDRIVQEMIRDILENIYEPIFSITHKDQNVGFRPRKSCHHAIDRLLREAQGMEWCIEGDIKGAYDNINHDLLIKILEERIKDREFIKLIKNGLKAGAIKEGKYSHTILGTPQGGIASPILFNIYMSKLDEYINTQLREDTLIKNILEKRTARPVTKSYRRLGYQLEVLKKAGKENEKEYSTTKNQLLKIPYRDKKRTVVRITYSRYADDWVLFTNGSKEYIEQVYDKVKVFLKRNMFLELSEEKTKITQITKDRVRFLGYSLSNFAETKRIKTIKETDKQSKYTKRSTGHQLVPGIDESRLITGLERKSYIEKRNGIYFGRRKPEWTVLTDYQIIMYYNSVMRGIANYYFMIRGVSEINKYIYWLKYSCAHTLANKHRLTIPGVFRKYGKDIAINEKEAKVKLLTFLDTGKNIHKLKEDWTTKIRNATRASKRMGLGEEEKIRAYNENFFTNEELTKDPLDLKINWRSTFKFIRECSICGSNDTVEMHHLRHIRKIGQKTEGFTRVMSQINRKQIPVCKKCHNNIHAGVYDDIALSEIHLNQIY